MLYLHNDLKKYFNSSAPLFDQLMALRGESFRHQKGRLTQRIQLGDKTYFIKQHHGVGWLEIIKNLLQIRLPVVGAKNEWLAIEKLKSLGVAAPIVVGYGQRGWNPAQLESFVLMEELKPTISLEDLGKKWQKEPPNFIFKKKLIEEVARMARIMHQNGINHRDFYICHFLLNVNQYSLAMIDLHRAQMRSKTPARWSIKDLAGLYFSSKNIGLTQRDLYRFIRAYRNKPLHDIFHTESNYWQQVKKRGEQLYRDHTK